MCSLSGALVKILTLISEKVSLFSIYNKLRIKSGILIWAVTMRSRQRRSLLGNRFVKSTELSRLIDIIGEKWSSSCHVGIWSWNPRILWIRRQFRVLNRGIFFFKRQRILKVPKVKPFLMMKCISKIFWDFKRSEILGRHRYSRRPHLDIQIRWSLKVMHNAIYKTSCRDLKVKFYTGKDPIPLKWMVVLRAWSIYKDLWQFLGIAR